MLEIQQYMNQGDMYNLYRGISEIVGPIRKALVEDENGVELKS